MDWTQWLEDMRISNNKKSRMVSYVGGLYENRKKIDQLEMAIGALLERIEALEGGYIQAVKDMPNSCSVSFDECKDDED